MRCETRRRTHSRRPAGALPGAGCLRLSRLLRVAARQPATRAAEPAIVSSRHPEPEAGGQGVRARKWILVAEDDRAVRMLLVRVLTDAGYSVVTAEDGFEALDATREVAPHLILLDLRMSRMSGVDFLRRSRGIPIVVLSGFLGDLTDEAASRANIVARLEKPVSLDVLRATVERALAG
jgi:two-component system, response regulator, stage 0 sporulation protein F